MKIKKYIAWCTVFIIIFLNGVSAFADSSVTAELCIDKIGHIFTDKSISIDAVITGSGELEYMMSVVYEDGKEVYSEKEKINIGSEAPETVSFNFNVPRYGFYNVSFSVKSGEAVAAEDTTRFSVMHSSGKKNKRIGINSHYQAKRGTADVDALQKLYADAGFGQMREGAPWTQYESVIGEYELKENHIKFLNAFKNNGQNNLFILGHESIPRNITFPRTQTELDAWCKYIEEIAQDVAPYGIKDFELWNEVNISSEFGLGTVTVEEYAALIKATKPILDKYIPDNRLFVFSLAGEQYTEQWSEFMDGCLAIDGCIDSFDGISIHPYSGRENPEEKLPAALAEVDASIEKWKLYDKAVIISEMGYTYGYDVETEALMDEQASLAVRLSALAFDEVEYTDWFMNVEYIDSTDPAKVHFGWLRGWKNQEINYEAKPVFIAMANFNAMLADAEANGNISLQDKDRYLYKFKRDGKDIYMIWKTEGTEKIKLAVGADKATVYDFYGNAVERATSNGALHLTISDKPLYVVGELTDCTYIDANIVTVRGNVGEKNKRVTIMVLRPDGVTEEKTGEFVYIGEAYTDEEGNYSFSFKDPAYDKGTYTIKMSVDGAVTASVYEYDIAVPKISLINNDGSEIESISDIIGDGIAARLEVINALDYSVSGDIICGMYNGDTLVSAEILPAYADGTEAVKSYSLKYDENKGIDMIKVFMWNLENISPVAESIVVE